MTVRLTLVFDFRAPRNLDVETATVYDAALEICEWADRLPLDGIRFSEHHGFEDGFCPSPLVAAAAVAARTRRARIRVRALVLPLHNPLRVAEDCAVVDNISRGRLELVIGAGYVPEEFAMLGSDFGRRAGLVEEGVQVLKSAWTGLPFHYRDRTVRVLPRPWRQPRPPLVLGGSTVAAAERAARIGDGFEPSSRSLFARYAEACERIGTKPGPPPPPTLPCRFLHVSNDPDWTWARIGKYLLHEAREFEALLRHVHGKPVPVTESVADLRDSGTHRVLQPQAALELIRSIGDDTEIVLHPLMGGLPREEAWASLELFRSEVLPHLPMSLSTQR